MAGRKEYHQFKYQEKLNAQSQAYGVENATTAYNRQRELTEDNALLQLQGMRKAGLSTSFSDGSSVGAASNVDQSATPSPGAAPEGIDISELLSRGIDNLSQSADMAVKAANVASLNQDTLGKSIDNQFKGIQALSSLDNLEEDTESKSLKNAYQSMQNDIMQQFGFSQAQAQTTVDKNNAYMSGVQADNIDFKTFLDNIEQIRRIDNILANTEVSRETRKNLEKQRDVYAAQINYYNAGAADSYSHVGVNTTQADVNKAEEKFIGKNTTSVQQQNEITSATKDAVIRAANLTVEEHGPQSISDYSWSIFNNWDKATTGQKWRACIGLPFAFLERAVGGAATGAAAGAGTNVGKNVTTKRPKAIKGFK